ncbi:histidine kinase [Pararhizobium polonicum]|uniref:histidine kinase n=1 Tax=Pararhizobium polonicum TaxID=1612624 RepID=A0A1C7NUC8_9HYPH|nr:sensor histidine kinase [Pararhizobium polonicum]OBZ92617.1 histidine kinase [Pararhizobium polonicum]
MELVLKKSGSGYLYQSDNLDVVFSGNLPEGLRSLEAREQADEKTFGAEDGARLTALKRDVARNCSPASTEIDVTSATGVLTYRIDIERIDTQGMTGILSVITDISETRHRERILKTLLRELSHRSKNLLAIIQGIATQTARQALSLDYFLTKFRGRIQSLAYSQDLVTDSSWRGAYLFALAERQFSAYWPDSETPIAIRGINAHLSPNAALHIGLALHELIVNSASYGAISAGVNSLTIDCFETALDGNDAIELTWIEHLPPAVTLRETDEHTFARTVLERVVPVAIGGRALYLTAPDRVEYHLTIPSREYEIIDRIDQ